MGTAASNLHYSKRFENFVSKSCNSDIILQYGNWLMIIIFIIHSD